jgi:hypothetical protein
MVAVCQNNSISSSGSLTLHNGSPLKLITYGDANWYTCSNTHLSTSGLFMYLGLCFDFMEVQEIGTTF